VRPAADLHYRTVLFDLDGTLADTAPDLYAAQAALSREQGLEPLPFDRVRNHVSHGSTALVRLAFPDAGGDRFEQLRTRFLEIYAKNLFRDTALFPGMESLLAWLESRGLNWGVVTNKPAFLTDPLMVSLGLAERAACIVSGDTIDERKPHPAPMWHACELAGSRPAECLYVGDAQRDIQAGQAAGMATLIALYGYIDEEQHPEQWGADGMIREPREILDWMLGTQEPVAMVGEDS
jgi:N-acetyl-D-muramate 6-phosphate phosphatase